MASVLAKHTKRFSLVDAVSIGVDRMQRSFEPMQREVEEWKESRIEDETAKLVIYRAFVEGDLEAPKHLARRVHDLYFNPSIAEFAPRSSVKNSSRVKHTPSLSSGCKRFAGWYFFHATT